MLATLLVPPRDVGALDIITHKSARDEFAIMVGVGRVRGNPIVPGQLHLDSDNRLHQCLPD